MSDFAATRLRLQVAALSPAFEGTPQEFIAELVRLSSIVSPTDFLYVVIGGSAPTTNEGIWLKDGTKPYVWDTGTSQYIPADLTDSLAAVLAAIAALQSQVGGGRVIFSATEPGAADRTNTIWVETLSSRPVSLRWWTGTVWAYLPDRFPAVTTTGTANAHVATLGLTGVSLADLKNRILFLRPGTTNTGATTLAVDGTAATSLRVGTTALAAGQFESGKEYLVVYDGTYYQLLNPSLPDVITAQTFTNVQSLTVNAKGQVTNAASVGSGVATIRAGVVFDGCAGASFPATALLTKTVTASDSAANTITIVGHGWSTGQLVWFTSLSISGPSEDVPYYVYKVDNDKLQLYKTLAGATDQTALDLVDITSTGTGLTDELTYWDGNPILKSWGVDGVIKIATAAGYVFGIDFTTDQADANYLVSGTASSGVGAGAPFCYLTEPTSWLAYDNSASMAYVLAVDEGYAPVPAKRFRVTIAA